LGQYPKEGRTVDFELTEDQATIRKAVRELAARFDDQYWMQRDAAHEFPAEFYQAFASAGWLGITTPQEYGGNGCGITEASLVLEEVAASGAAMNGASSIHMSIFGMHPVIVHGSEAMKRENLPRIASGDLHVCFGVTEPGAGLDTTRITTFARSDGPDYVINRGMLADIGEGDRACTVFGSPLHLPSSPPPPTWPAPLLGEHTQQILRDRLNLTDEEISQLTAEGAI
jgi:Acyl-CoA dehydrogenase, N-terminal domain